MPSPTRHQLLLQTVCDFLPPAEATRIAAMSPSDYLTFAEAYCAVRLLPAFTPDLKRVLVNTICELMDAEAEHAYRIRNRRSALAAVGPDAHQHEPGRVIQLPRRSADQTG